MFQIYLLFADADSRPNGKSHAKTHNIKPPNRPQAQLASKVCSKLQDLPFPLDKPAKEPWSYASALASLKKVASRVDISSCTNLSRRKYLVSLNCISLLISQHCTHIFNLMKKKMGVSLTRDKVKSKRMMSHGQVNISFAGLRPLVLRASSCRKLRQMKALTGRRPLRRKTQKFREQKEILPVKSLGIRAEAYLTTKSVPAWKQTWSTCGRISASTCQTQNTWTTLKDSCNTW